MARRPQPKIQAKHAALWPILCVLVVATLVPYLNSFGSGFPLDNKGLILQDPRVRAATAQNLDQILNHTYWWPYGESGLYRPLTTLTYLFNYAILGNGDRPFGYHVVNFGLHAINVLLVYALARRVIRLTTHSNAERVPALIAVAWGVHPVLTESVTNIIGRADLLAAFGVLAGVLMYAKSTDVTGARRIGWLIGVTAAAAVGVFSKESAVVLPSLILLYEFAAPDKGRRTRTTAGPPILGVLATLPALITMLVKRSSVLAAAGPSELPFTDNPLIGAGFWQAKLTALSIVGRYLSLLMWPAQLSSDYSYAAIPYAQGSMQDWLSWLAVAGSIILVVTAWWWNRAVFFFGTFAFITFLPTANLLFPIGTIMAERFLYLPSIAFAACLVLAVDAAGRRLRVELLTPAVVGVLVLAFGVRTWMRNPDWHDDLTLGTATVKTIPASFKGHKMLAAALYEADSARAGIDRVIAEADEAIAILAPLPDARADSETHVRAGAYHLITCDRPNALDRVGECRKARAALQRALSIARTFGDRMPRVRLGEIHRLLSAADLRLGDRQQALDEALLARELDPAMPDVYRRLYEALAQSERDEDAAVAMMAGVMVTADVGLRNQLIDLYRKGLDPLGCAVSEGPTGPTLNAKCETVQRHLCAAAAEAIRVLTRTGRTDLVEPLKATAVQQFQCDADSLPR